jgi:hypothetical protein
VIVIAELCKDGFRVFLCLVGDFLAELVAFAENFAHGLDDVVGVAVGLGEDQGLRDLVAAWKNLRQSIT